MRAGTVRLLTLCSAPRPSGSHFPTFAMPQTPARALLNMPAEIRVGTPVSENQAVEAPLYTSAEVRATDVPPAASAIKWRRLVLCAKQIRVSTADAGPLICGGVAGRRLSLRLQQGSSAHSALEMLRQLFAACSSSFSSNGCAGCL